MSKNDIKKLPNYNIKEVSHYLRLPYSTARAWCSGQQNFEPLISISQKKPPLLSFYNLVEVFVLHSITRKFHLSMQKMRLALEYVKEKFDSPTPLIEKEFATDGIKLFLNESGVLIDVTSNPGQLALKELNTYLKRVDRNKLGVPIRLYPFSRTGHPNEPKSIFIDPNIYFGRPVLAERNIPTDIIAERLQAGETPEHLAGDYGVGDDEVLEAIRFELGLQKAA